MANYVERIKVANGEPWPVRDVEAHIAIDDAKKYAVEQIENAIANVPTRWQVLWSNPDPLMPMAESEPFARDINFNDYDMYLIVCRHTTGMGYESSCLMYGMYCGTVYFPKMTFQGNTLNDSARYFTISQTAGTASCSNGYLSGNPSNSACIPIRIYGARA